MCLTHPPLHNTHQRYIIQSKVNLIRCIHGADVRDESNYIAFDLLLRYFTSATSPTSIHNVIIEIFHISDVSDMSNIGLNFILYYNSNYLN